MRIKIAEITPDSPASAVGLRAGDEIVTLDGVVPRDVLDYSRLAAEPGARARLGDGLDVPAEALSGAVLDEAVFDGVQTCDNHCEFCFIYQLPKGMRRPLYLKDDDYRLSALYGNFTTLTRFTEADLERVVDERISPLHVSVHATDPFVRAEMLRNRKGGTSLRWLRAVLDHDIEVHAQIVLCPGTNDGPVLEQTLADLLAGYPELASVGIVPLGVSGHNTEPGLRPPTAEDALAILDTAHRFQSLALDVLGRRFVFASDEVYLLAGRPFPPADAYEGFPQHENGIGMARALEADLAPEQRRAAGSPPWGYRPADTTPGLNRPRKAARSALMTGTLGAAVVAPLVGRLSVDGVEIQEVPNEFFGGNIGVTGLLSGADLCTAIRGLETGVEAVVPDVVFNEGRTLDEWTLLDLLERTSREVRVVSADAAGLRAAVGA